MKPSSFALKLKMGLLVALNLYMKKMKKKHHLIVSIIILIPIAFVYGNASNLADSFHFKITEVDLKNILKATMGLYLAVICLWVYGIINTKPLWTASP